MCLIWYIHWWKKAVLEVCLMQELKDISWWKRKKLRVVLDARIMPLDNVFLRCLQPSTITSVLSLIGENCWSSRPLCPWGMLEVWPTNWFHLASLTSTIGYHLHNSVFNQHCQKEAYIKWIELAQLWKLVEHRFLAVHMEELSLCKLKSIWYIRLRN